MFKLPRFHLPALIERFRSEHSGATAIEYAIIASSVAVAIAAAVMKLGSTVNGLYTNVYNLLR